jgi:predicted porin
MKVEKVESKVDTKSASLTNLEWAERIKIKGDMRFRHETENVDSAGTSKTNEEDRLRIRARVGVYADINDTTKAGIRLVSSPGSATSTNLSLENNFGNSFAGIDLAYIDWAPEMLGGDTNIVVGKMEKQWVQVNDVIWDGDTNPEGASIKSKFDLGDVNLIPSAGYYTLDDNGNDSFTEDSHVGHAQLAAEFGDAVFGVSYYGFENMNTVSEEERMFEVFGQTAIPGTPITVFASHVTNSNADASGDDDNAWSLGANAKLGNFKLGYEYRDLGVNAVNDAFDNSDFLSDSKGSIFTAGYTIDKNFSVGATYYTSETNIDGSDLDVDLLHLDLVAKF